MNQKSLFEDLQLLLAQEKAHEFESGVKAAIKIIQQHFPIFLPEQVLNHKDLGKIRVSSMAEEWIEYGDSTIGYVRVYTVRQVECDKDPFGEPYDKTWEFTEEQLLEIPVTAKSVWQDERYKEADFLKCRNKWKFPKLPIQIIR